MLRPNYETTFEQIVGVLTTKQATTLQNFANGLPNQFEQRFVKYPIFVMFQCEANLQTDNPDTVTMNANLDYLLNQWDY